MKGIKALYTRLSKNIKLICVVILIFFITYPLYFQILREAAFNTMPRDDYAPFLLKIVETTKGEVPPSPYIYRILAVLVAVPFYYMLPNYKFTNLCEIDSEYYKAVQALMAVSYLSILGCSFFIFMISYKRLGASFNASLITCFIGFLFSGFIHRVGIDPFTLLIISMLIYYIKDNFRFSLLLIFSTFVNEKILILFFSILFLRFCYSCFITKEFSISIYQLLVSIAAVILYLSARLFFQFPGNEYQMQIDKYFPNILINLSLCCSFKGFILIVIPLFLLSIIVSIFIAELRNNELLRKYFFITDIFGVVSLTLIALMVNVEYNVGRIAMLSLPIYLPAISFVFDRYQSIKRNNI